MSEPVTDEDLYIVWLDAAKRTRQQTEREIVAWLRERAKVVGADGPMKAALMEIPLGLADAIERGEYRK